MIGLALVFDAAGAAPLDIQGHRGARGLMPENSLPAFARAVALGVHTLELDVQATKDRVLVVHHDPLLDSKRCVDDDGGAVPPRPIEELHYAELMRIDCGRRADPRFPLQQPVSGTRIPRLEEVLMLARDASYAVRLNMELKWQGRNDGLSIEELAERLVLLVKRFGLERRTTVQSFHPAALKAVSRLDPSIARAILVQRRDDYERLVEEGAATILSPRYEGLHRQDVVRFQRRGIAVIPWTVNEAADICRLIAWGVDGLITDYPDRALRLANSAGC